MHDLTRQSSGKGFWSGVEKGVHLLERGVKIAGSLKAGYDTAMAIGSAVAPLLV